MPSNYDSRLKFIKKKKNPNSFSNCCGQQTDSGGEWILWFFGGKWLRPELLHLSATQLINKNNTFVRIYYTSASNLGTARRRRRVRFTYYVNSTIYRSVRMPDVIEREHKLHRCSMSKSYLGPTKFESEPSSVPRTCSCNEMRQVLSGSGRPLR